MNKKFDIVGVDMPCIDLNLNMASFPKPNGGARVNQLSWQGGGKVASGMVAAARQGAKCAMMGAAGSDIFGRFCVDDFKRHGIDTEAFCVREGESTSLSVVLSDKETGGRSFVFRPGSAPRFRFTDFNQDYLKNTRYFFICSADAEMRPAVSMAKEAGASIVADADQPSPDMMALIPEIDYFIASEFVYYHLFKNDDFEDNLKTLFTKNHKAIIFTFGEKGCAGIGGQGYFYLPAFKVETADTVGAGDVFHGSFIAALLDGCSVYESARRASATSAIKCTRIGGRAGVPDKKTLLRYLETGEIDYTEIDQRVAFYEDLGKSLNLY